MAETEAISQLATKVSDELFGVFGWSKHGPRNQNWACVVPSHEKKTHPADVVFSYEDPYAGRVYVLVDLKSYAKASITKAAVAGAVKSLGVATECAHLSPQFETLYLSNVGVERRTTVSLLFVYNHDGEYTTDFDEHLLTIHKSNFALAPGRRMFVMGPQHISYLYNVARDIAFLRGTRKIPFAEDCRFYYPDMVRTATLSGKEAAAASLEWLTGPWQILRFTKELDGGGIRSESYVYYRDPGASTDEFKYLFDYFFRYQLIEPGNVIHVRAVPSRVQNAESSALFEKAKHEYAARTHPKDQVEFRKRLDDISYSTVEATYLKFSEIEAGMERG